MSTCLNPNYAFIVHAIVLHTSQHIRQMDFPNSNQKLKIIATAKSQRQKNKYKIQIRHGALVRSI